MRPRRRPAVGAPATSGKAIWSLILGFISMFCIPFFPAIPAIILGFLGMRDVKRNPQALRGKGMAIAGLILGLLNTGGTCLAGVAAVGIFMLGQSANEKDSSNNLKQIALPCTFITMHL